jgi:hypothetical protein
MFLVHRLRTTDHEVTPVPVLPLGYDGLVELREGRHRYTASIIAGRSHIPAVLDPEADPALHARNGVGFYGTLGGFRPRYVPGTT